MKKAPCNTEVLKQKVEEHHEDLKSDVDDLKGKCVQSAPELAEKIKNETSCRAVAVRGMFGVQGKTVSHEWVQVGSVDDSKGPVMVDATIEQFNDPEVPNVSEGEVSFPETAVVNQDDDLRDYYKR